MKIFKKNRDSVEYVINFVSIIMLCISGILTIALYSEDGNSVISTGIFGGMGLTMELAKIIFIVLLGFFILKRMVKESFVTGILCIVLLGISVYANYTYSMNSDSRKLDNGKTETQEYKQISSQKSKLESELNKLNSSKAIKEKSIVDYDSKIAEQVKIKDETIAKYDDVWSRNNTAKQYNTEIERLNNDKNTTNADIKDIDTKANSINNQLATLNTKLNSTKQYKYNKNKGVNSNVIRIILGVMFEIIAVSLFFLGILRKNRLIKERNGVKTPQEIFENAVNDLIINVTTAYTEQIKAQTRLFSQQFSQDKVLIHDAEVKQICDEKVDKKFDEIIEQNNNILEPILEPILEQKEVQISEENLKEKEDQRKAFLNSVLSQEEVQKEIGNAYPETNKKSYKLSRKFKDKRLKIKRAKILKFEQKVKSEDTEEVKTKVKPENDDKLSQKLRQKLSRYLDKNYDTGDVIKIKELREKFDLTEARWKKIKTNLPIETKGTKSFYRGEKHANI
jgi:cell division protein FtsB